MESCASTWLRKSSKPTGGVEGGLMTPFAGSGEFVCLAGCAFPVAESVWQEAVFGTKSVIANDPEPPNMASLRGTLACVLLWGCSFGCSPVCSVARITPWRKGARASRWRLELSALESVSTSVKLSVKRSILHLYPPARVHPSTDAAWTFSSLESLSGLRCPQSGVN